MALKERVTMMWRAGTECSACGVAKGKQLQITFPQTDKKMSLCMAHAKMVKDQMGDAVTEMGKLLNWKA